VTGVGTRPFAALIAAVFVAALLAACGGSDSDSSSSTEGAAPGTKATTETTASDGAKGGAQAPSAGKGQAGAGGQSHSDDQSQSRQSSKGGSRSRSGGTPLEVSGGGSEQFRSNGGDNSIQEFGEESDESELREAAEVVHSFYVARTEGQWDTACSYLAKSNVEQLEQLAAQSPQSKGADCAALLKAFTRPLPAALEREITTVDAGSLRREGDQGFLIYYGARHQTYAMPLKEEGGSWKVTALSATTLG
jgi:hypothetical protein